MKKKQIEFSQIVRTKLLKLRSELTQAYGNDISKSTVRKIKQAADGLGVFAEKGISVRAMYHVDSDYRYLYIAHNYLFYRIEPEKIIIVEMFHEREDFMQKLFGIKTTSQETLDYWQE